MYSLYNIGIIILFILISPFFSFKIIFSKRWREGIRERFGFFSKETTEKIEKNTDYILIRAASVGEVRACQVLEKELKKSFPNYKIVFSTVTPEGNKVAQDLHLGDIKIFSPLDFLFSVKRVLKVFKPKLLILIETEIWPNLIRESKKAGAKIILINGRISEGSFPYYKYIKPLLKDIFGYIDFFSMREEIDKNRIIFLGANPDTVVISGNIKYDQISDNLCPLEYKYEMKDINKIYKEFGLNNDDLIFVAGSIREGEEEKILRAYQQVLGKFPYLKLIIAPRHLDRLKEIEKIIKAYSLQYITKTEILLNSSLVSNNQIVLLNTIGELMKAYSIATVTFVGGSLVPKGGQNIMEPASLGKPVLFGPYIESFFEPAQVLMKTNGAIEVKDFQELAEKIIYFLDNAELRVSKGEQVRQAVLSMQGATQRNIDLMKKIVS